MKKLILLSLILSSSAALAQTETTTQFQVTSDAISAYIQQMKLSSTNAQYNGSDYVDFRKFYDQKVEGALLAFEKGMTKEILPRIGVFMAENSLSIEAQISFYQEIFESKILTLYGLFPNLNHSKVRLKYIGSRLNVPDIKYPCGEDSRFTVFEEWSFVGKINRTKIKSTYINCPDKENPLMGSTANVKIHDIFYKEALKFC